MLATAFQLLHFKKFLAEYGPLPESLSSIILSLKEEPSSSLLETVEASEAMKNFMLMYAEYCDATLDGEHGSTARFWMIYIKLVHIFLRFNRACRTNDLDLFIYSLGEMCAIFFACNRPNYSRWMVRYHFNLMNVDETHPGVCDTLKNGALSIRRTDKAFSRTPVDMTLEQTVNADAASRLTGISAFSTSVGARGRWMITRSARSAIVGALLLKAGLSTLEDTTKELKTYRIKKDTDDLNCLVDGIQTRMNPFTLDHDNNLYCLTTGKNVPDDIKEDLLHCVELGEAWCEDFTTGCFQDAKRFEKPIQRRKIKNFASAAVKSKVTKDQKVIELKGTRDLFGRLLYLSTVHKVDMEKVFSYPLTPVPLSLGHVDGSINKTDKAKLMHKLENTIQSVDPTNVTNVIVDGMFLLHTQKNIPGTYGELAHKILGQLCQLSLERVDIVFDTYNEPSIKVTEHTRREQNDALYTITGPQQKCPRDWQKALQSTAFKTRFCKFLLEQWVHADPSILSNHVLYVGVEKVCYLFRNNNGVMVVEEVPHLSCSHQEADTRIIFHLQHILQADPDKTITVRSSDTDIFILLIYHLSKQTTPAAVWMDVGLCSNNTRRFINICQLINQMNPKVIDALPALHAFTGCDYTASFMNKGKIKALDLLAKHDHFKDAFGNLGNSATPSSETFSKMEAFTCALYGMPKLQNINDVRFALFLQKYAPKKQNEPLDKVKGINPSSMPPCQSVLRKKILRTHFVTHIWKNATLPNPCQLKPDTYGWSLSDGNYSIQWYEGSQLPEAIINILKDTNLDEEDDDADNAADDSESDDDMDEFY